MQDLINRLLDRNFEADYSNTFMVLVVVAVFTQLYLAQVAWHDDERNGVPRPLAWIRRAAATFLSLALLWTLEFGWSKDWQPWPPLLFIIFGMCMHNISRIAAHHWRTFSSMHAELY